MDRKNKLMLIAAIGAVAVLIASSAVRCSMARPAETVPASGQQQSQQAEEPPAAQADDESAMGILKSHVWQAEGEPKDTCTFKEGSFVESKDGKLTATAFAAGDEASTDKQTTLTITPLREDASGDAKAAIIIDGKEGSYTVSCDAFQLHKTYVQGKAPDVELEVTGLADEYMELIDGKQAELQSAVGEWAAKNAPAATKASFDGEVYLDLKAGRVTATFHLDDSAASIVSVAYADGKFSVSG